ncbi:MAG: histidine phosphatase family protein [Deltaproteobacteria bacterium]|nr:histidine phosphatase family protein [Deltaproteobacteria bacterium]
MALDGSITSFGLLRHAETVWNRENRIQGHSDLPLAPEGKRKSRRLGHILAAIPWDRIITSDLNRAVETAKLINFTLNVSIHCDERLREQNWGRWEGKTIKEIDRLISTKSIESGWNFRPPGGEDRISVATRSRAALTDAATRWPGDTILVVTHHGVIRCLMYNLTKRTFLSKNSFPLLRYDYLHFLQHDGYGLKVVKTNAIGLNLL